LSEEFAILPIHRPKEKRGDQPIVWCLTIRRHEEPSLCPVATLIEYYSRIKDTPCSIPHPKEPRETYTPLVRHCKDLSLAASKDTISNHAAAIGDKLVLPPGMKKPRGRATDPQPLSKP
ncbi:hypothetical protein BGZ58_005081, partial [Dissophora ornata]